MLKFVKFILFIIPLTIVTFAVLVLVSPPFVPGRRKIQDWSIQTWNRSFLKIFGLNVKVQGLENYDPKKPCIIIGNHQSLLDIPVAYAVFSGSLRMVAKASLFNIPVFGWGLYISDYIKIHRGDKKSAQKSIEAIAKRLSSGLQIWMAPEGTRSKDGTLGPFKSGAFRSAISLKVPIIPFVIYNSGDINPKGSLTLKAPGTLYAKILPPIDATKFQLNEYSKLRDQAREAMATALAQSTN